MRHARLSLLRRRNVRVGRVLPSGERRRPTHLLRLRRARRSLLRSRRVQRWRLLRERLLRGRRIDVHGRWRGL